MHFKLAFNRLDNAVKTIKQEQGLQGKVDAQLMYAVRDHLRLEYKFSAGVVSEADATLLNLNARTTWLSDDTLVKQFNSREGQDFGVAEYAKMPDVIFDADRVLKSIQNEKVNKLYFYKQINNRWYMVVAKHLSQTGELFAESFRLSSLKQVEKEMKKYDVIRVSR